MDRIFEKTTESGLDTEDILKILIENCIILSNSRSEKINFKKKFEKYIISYCKKNSLKVIKNKKIFIYF
jgi:hypothetical protein